MIFIDFYWFLEPQEAGTPAAGWPADGLILSGGVAWQAGGQQAERNQVRTPFRKRSLGKKIDQKMSKILISILMHFRWILGRFGASCWPENPPKINKKSIFFGIKKLMSLVKA